MTTAFYLSSKENKRGEAPIQVSISHGSIRVMTTVGYSISPSAWDSIKSKVKKNYANHKGIPADAINARINAIRSTFDTFAAKEATLNRHQILDAIAIACGKRSSLDRSHAESIYPIYDLFLKDGRDNLHWALNTYKKFITTLHHLTDYNKNLRFSDFNKDFFDSYIHYCSSQLNMLDTSVSKELSLIRWFLGWATENGYNTNMVFKTYRARLKNIKNPVIFLTSKELLTLYNLQIPKNGTILTLQKADGTRYEKKCENKSSMDKARDLFCFCALTSLRYSDMSSLMRANIYDGCIHITTQKTNDTLVIEINDKAQKILDKYSGFDFDGLALPPLSNQKMNQYLKDLCEIAGFNSLISIPTFIEGVRIDQSVPKWQLISTHAARRTFICHALSIGIPPQVVMRWTGHNDYKAMKPYIDVASETKSNAMNLFSQTL